LFDLIFLGIGGYKYKEVTAAAGNVVVKQGQQSVAPQQQYELQQMNTLPQQQYVPMQQQYVPPQQQYVPMHQQFAPPQQPYVPPQQQYTPEKQHAPQQQQYAVEVGPSYPAPRTALSLESLALELNIPQLMNCKDLESALAMNFNELKESHGISNEEYMRLKKYKTGL
jgi:hypothetical protein